jgi:predicted GTPase
MYEWSYYQSFGEQQYKTFIERNTNLLQRFVCLVKPLVVLNRETYSYEST